MSDQSLELLNCGGQKVRFDFVCPMSWDALEETEHTRQRFCAQCQQRVTLCVNAAEAALRTDQNECIAVPAWFAEGVRRDDRRIIVGRPERAREWAKIVQARLDEQTSPDPSKG